MSSKSNLELARKYEWNAMMSKYQSNISSMERYESMAKMATIDAGIDFSRESSYNSVNPINSIDRSINWKSMNSRERSVCAVSFILTVAFFVALYIFAGIL